MSWMRYVGLLVSDGNHGSVGGSPHSGKEATLIL